MNSNTIQPRHDTNASSAFSQALGATLTALLLATLLMSVPSVTLAQDADDHTTQAELNTHNTDVNAHGGTADHTTQAELDAHNADTTAHGDAKAAADTAQARADAAHDLAEKAEGEAGTAQGRADAAHDLAEKAEGEAGTAQGRADAAHDLAEKAEGEAGTAQGRADAAHDLAAEADGAADAAQMTADENLDKLGEGASNSNRNIHIGVRAGTADTQGADAIAIGTDSSATGENGVAIGNGVVAGANEIVIGSAAHTATIAGININELDQDVTTNRDGIAELDQSVTTNRAGIAMAFAFAHLPTVQGGGWGIAAGTFESETAFAIGAHFELDNNVHLKVGGSASSDGEDSGFGIGFSKGW